MTPLRLFLALWPDAAARRALVDAQRRWRWNPRAAVVAAQRLHVTLHFIGALDAARLPALGAALPPLPQPFVMDFGRARLWPRGVAVLEPLAVPEALLELHGRLAQALRALDLPVETRALRPHVTLARHALGARAPDELAPWSWPVAGYALVSSLAGPPPRYDILQRVG